MWVSDRSRAVRSVSDEAPALAGGEGAPGLVCGVVRGGSREG